jgi:hypothetical protein
VVQPSLLSGESEGLAIISQYNPHGVFIAMQDLYCVRAVGLTLAVVLAHRETRPVH